MPPQKGIAKIQEIPQFTKYLTLLLINIMFTMPLAKQPFSLSQRKYRCYSPATSCTNRTEYWFPGPRLACAR